MSVWLFIVVSSSRCRFCNLVSVWGAQQGLRVRVAVWCLWCHWSVWLDLYILARTVGVVLSGEGAY